MNTLDEAVAMVLACRRGGNIDALLVLDPDAAREEMAPEDPRHALFDGGDADAEGALAAAIRLRNACEADLPRRLLEAHTVCGTLVERAWLRVALRPQVLVRRTTGELPMVLLPHRLRAATGTWVDLSRSPRRFHLFWALAAAEGPLHVDELFARAWGRLPCDDEDLVALRAAVSRSRGVFDDLDIVRISGGYALEPSVALYTHRLAPVGPEALAPVGRELEAARLRRHLFEEGLAILSGPLGSGCSHLARHVAGSWPGGSCLEDRRIGRWEAAGDRLLVVDHAVGELPPERPLLWVTAEPHEDAVRLGPLSVREGASLAKSLGAAPPTEPTLPLWIRVDPGEIDQLGPLERSMLALLLGVPGGATAAELAAASGASMLSLLGTLSGLCRRRLIRQVGDRYVTEHAFSEVFAPEVPAGWAREAPPVVPEWSWGPVAPLLVQAHRDLARATTSERAQALIGLVRVAFRAGRPDRGAEAELASLPLGVAADRADWLQHRGERQLWGGSLLQARQLFGEAARIGSWLGSSREAVALAWDAEASLRLGLEVQAARSIGRVEALTGLPQVHLRAALAIDQGDLDRAADLVASPRSPEVVLRSAQVAALVGSGPVPLEGVHAHFQTHDRRWSSIAFTLDAVLHRRPGLLKHAERTLVTEDGGSRVALSLAAAWFAGEIDPARTILRQPVHQSTATYTWDLVRTVFADHAAVMQRGSDREK